MKDIIQFLGPLLFIAIIFVISLFSQIVKIAQEWERGVVLRLGKFDRTRGPGLFFLIPFVERTIKVDVRVVAHEVPPQEVITRDNVTIKVSAVIYFRVLAEAAANAVCRVYNYYEATSQISQTTLRSILGQHDLDDLLANRDKINVALQKIIDDQTEPWGVKVSAVEIKDVELPQSMQRAMAKQAEAEREKRAKFIHAEGEFQASQRLADAAEVLSKHTSALQLRFLQTLTEISQEKNSTILFPVPIDTLKPFMDMATSRLPAAAMPGPSAPPPPPAGS